MTALLLGGASGGVPAASALTRRSFAAREHAGGADVSRPGGNSYDEYWLQQLLFEHPELIPLERIETGAGEVTPICRELSIPREGGTVFLDMLGVTRAGRLVLVECKLWRNPQARREVIAQITEYAALLRRWSFSDLTERLKLKERWTGVNPLYDLARRSWPDLDEATFVDGLSRSLARGDFHLVIAGDGIRSDLQAITAHLADQRAGMARLSLLEIQIWSDSAGRTLVVPNLSLKTEVLQQRVLIADSGLPIVIDQRPLQSDSSGESIERIVDPDQVAQRLDNRAFWQRFIDEVSFAHPEQPAPRHGGNNWVRIDMPAGMPAITVYRSGKDIGLLLRLPGDQGRIVLDQFQADIDVLRRESGLDLSLAVVSGEPFQGEISITRPRSELSTDDEQLAWLKETADRFVSLLRPRLKALAADEATE